MSSNEPWPELPLMRTSADAPRRVGVELEFAGVSIETASDVVHTLFGGEVRVETRHRHWVEGGALGGFKVELDFKFAHRDSAGSALISESVDAELRGFLGDLGQGVLPLEIVCPPIPIHEAHRLEALVEALRQAGAVGAEGGLIYAFAAQLNPEMAEESVEHALTTLRAFLLLRDWLRDEIRIDISRRFWAFAKPFPTPFMRRVLDPGYAPDLDRFIADYIEACPTRNMELDMLPALRWLNEAAVVSRLPEETINARPAFHYRLPNARLSDRGWTLREEWTRWAVVERLAAQPDRLETLCREWLRADAASLVNGWTPASRAIAAML